MIKNIVFDIGNVLATFHPKEFLHELLNDENKEKKAFDALWFFLKRRYQTQLG